MNKKSEDVRARPKHSKTPWCLTDGYVVYSRHMEPIAEMFTMIHGGDYATIANSELIVQAVNRHHRFVGMAREVRKLGEIVAGKGDLAGRKQLRKVVAIAVAMLTDLDDEPIQPEEK